MVKVNFVKTFSSAHLILLTYICAFMATISSGQGKDGYQNEDTTVQYNSIDEHPYQNPDENDRKAMLRKNRYYQYHELAVNQFMVLGQEAQQAGIVASSQEIATRLKAFKKLFPGELFSEYELELEICAKKIGDSICNGSSAVSSEVQRFYNDIKIEWDRDSVPDFETIKPLLETVALLNVCPAFREMGNKLVTAQENIMNERYKAHNTSWTSKELQVDADSGACIASHIDSNCILSVGEYNKYIRFYHSNKLNTNQESRGFAVQNMLKDKYIRSEAIKKGFAENDSAKKEQEEWIENQKYTLKYGKIGLPVTSYNELLMAYDKYYDLLFSKKIKLHCSIIGSSDSTFVDSIYKMLSESKLNNKTDGSAAGKKETDAAESSIPWAHSNGNVLSPEFMNVLDTLKLDSVSEVLRFNFGFFIVRLDSVLVKDAIPFENSMKEATLLATKMKWQNYDSLLLEQAASIYKNNPRINRVKDTLMLQACLEPGMVSVTNNNGGNGDNKLEPGKESDTLKVFIRINSEMLPYDVKNQLLENYMPSKKTARVSSPYGTWFFKVTGSRKAQGKIPFSMVRKTIVDSLVMACTDSSLFIVDTTIKMDSVGYQVSLANVYTPHFYGIHKNTQKTPEEMASAARKQQELEKNLFSKVTVDSSLLFRGIKVY